MSTTRSSSSSNKRPPKPKQYPHERSMLILSTDRKLYHTQTSDLSDDDDEDDDDGSPAWTLIAIGIAMTVGLVLAMSSDVVAWTSTIASNNPDSIRRRSDSRIPSVVPRLGGIPDPKNRKSTTIISLDESDQLTRQRRLRVKQAMQHAWSGYTQYAFGMDELLPVSKQGSNVWNGLSTTLVDSLDTLWLMDLHDEFEQAREYLAQYHHRGCCPQHHYHDYYATQNVSVICFETTIRSLGGLLAAYSWSHDRLFLDQALDLAQRIVRSFDHAPTGIPFGRVNLRTGEAHNDHFEDYTPLSWVGTLQLEFRWLDAYVHTEETKQMRHQVESIIVLLHQLDPPRGLYPTLIRNVGVTKPEFANDHLTFGANGDSFYEYLLKAWIQGGKQESLYREMYDQAIQGLHDTMIRYSTPSGLTYFIDWIDGKEVHKLHHLTCFMGGLLSLGAYTDPLGFDSTRAQRDLKTAKELTYTCYQMYARMPTGLSPEEVEFIPGHDFQLEGQEDIHPEGDLSAYGTRPNADTTSSQYIMRPEVVESFYILHAITQDPIYREWAWEIFQAIETYTKTDIAYGEFPNVANVSATPNDKMESFFLAETLKYLYLLLDPDSPVDVLSTHVFNTEAHPLPVFDKLER